MSNWTHVEGSETYRYERPDLKIPVYVVRRRTRAIKGLSTFWDVYVDNVRVDTKSTLRDAKAVALNALCAKL